MKIIQAIFGEDENPIKMDGRFFSTGASYFSFSLFCSCCCSFSYFSQCLSLSFYYFSAVDDSSSSPPPSLSFSLVPSLSILILLFFFQTQKMLVSDWWKKARTGEFRYICQRWNVYYTAIFGFLGSFFSTLSHLSKMRLNEFRKFFSSSSSLLKKSRNRYLFFFFS